MRFKPQEFILNQTLSIAFVLGIMSKIYPFVLSKRSQILVCSFYGGTLKTLGFLLETGRKTECNFEFETTTMSS